MKAFRFSSTTLSRGLARTPGTSTCNRHRGSSDQQRSDLGPDGKTVVSRATWIERFLRPAIPACTSASKDGQRQYIAVNFMNRQYSNINHPALNWAKDFQPTGKTMKQEAWFYLLLLAVALLALEWYTYHRRITL
jgi:hypothetical protein